MKIKHVYEILDNYMRENPDMKEKELEISLSEPSIGPTAATGISSVIIGFDWDNGRILMMPEDGLLRRSSVSSLLKKKKSYRIIKCTDHEMKDRLSYKDRIGKIVLEPFIDKMNGMAWMDYLYEADGKTMPYGKILKTSPVSKIIKDFNEGKETMTIITENSYIFLEEISIPL